MKMMTVKISGEHIHNNSTFRGDIFVRFVLIQLPVRPGVAWKCQMKLTGRHRKTEPRPQLDKITSEKSDF